MWIEKTKKGYRAVERYTDPVTGKVRKASVSMERNTASSRKVAEKALIQKIKDITSSVSKDITMSELIDLWLEGIKDTAKPSSCRTYKINAKAVLKVIPPDALVDNISIKYIKKPLLKVDSKVLRNTIIQTIKQVVRWGYANDLVKDISWLDKLQYETIKEKKDKIIDKYLESHELNTLIESMKKQKYRDLTIFLALTGMRIGEALALEYTDIDMTDRSISISKTFNYNINQVLTAKTQSSIRKIYIQDELYPLCKRLVQASSANRLVSKNVFHNCVYPTYNKYIKRHSKKYVGKAVTPHALRHTHVALLAENGIPFDVIARRLGHENSDITKNIYFHVTQKLQEKDFNEVKEIHIL